MGVFAENTLTVTRSHGGAKDSNPLILKALAGGGAIATETALSGTKGVDCSLIHGDSWNQMDGKLTENIQLDFLLTVTGNEVHKVVKNLTHRVNGKSNDTRVGVHNQTNISPRNDEFLHTRSETHHQNENRTQKTEDIDWSEKLTEFRKEHTEWNWLKLGLITGPEVSLNPVVAYEAKALAVANKGIAAENVVLDCEIKEIGTAIALVAGQVKATVLKAAVTHLKAIGFNGNAGVAANGDSPLA